MRKFNTYKIDPTKLRREFEVRNLNLKEASIAIGYSETYIYKILSRGKNEIPKTAALLLENLYHIKPEAYVIPDEPVQEWDPLAETERAPEIDYNKLGDIIYEAVYQSVKAALIEVREYEEER